MLCNLCRIEYDLIQDATRQEKSQLVYLQLNKLKGLSCRIQSDLKKRV